MVSEDALTAGGLVTLTTDFGLKDGYVAAMKAAILSRDPAVRIVDLSHEITPQAVLEAAFVLESVSGSFPAGSVNVCVVDPGVGTSRKRLAIASGGSYFVGPDNGCLSAALPESVRGLRAAGERSRPRVVELADDVFAVAIENEALLAHPVSATFEGRDVFAPVAAYLATGGSIHDLGRRLDSSVAFPAFRAPATPTGLDGRVLYVDSFGNLITDVRAADLQPGAIVRAGGRRLALSHTYAVSDGLTAIVGSNGFVELAMPHGSGAHALGLGPGDRVGVAWG